MEGRARPPRADPPNDAVMGFPEAGFLVPSLGGEGGPHLDTPAKETLAEHPEGDAPAVGQVGLMPQQPVGSRVVDVVATHVLFQCFEVVFQVMTHHQLALQELQDLARKTCTPHITQVLGWVWGNLVLSWSC